MNRNDDDGNNDTNDRPGLFEEEMEYPAVPLRHRNGTRARNMMNRARFFFLRVVRGEREATARGDTRMRQHELQQILQQRTSRGRTIARRSHGQGDAIENNAIEMDGFNLGGVPRIELPSDHPNRRADVRHPNRPHRHIPLLDTDDDNFGLRVGFRNIPAQDMDDDNFLHAILDDDDDDEGRVFGRRLFPRRQPRILVPQDTPHGPSTSGLFDMVREGRTCKSVLSGWGRSKQGCCDSIVSRCASHPGDVHFENGKGRLPLHEACLRKACPHVIRALVDATDQRLVDLDNFRNSPLHLLFMDDCPQSDESSTNTSLGLWSHGIWSPEDLAVVVDDLLAFDPGPMVSSANESHDTPLHSACAAPETIVHPSIIERILRACPKSATKVNRKNQTPLWLHCRRRYASPEAAKLLLDESPRALTTLDSVNGWAPIHAAASTGNFKLLRYLVEAKPEFVNVRTAKYESALHLLCQNHTHLSPQAGNRKSGSGNNSDGSAPDVMAAVAFLLKADPEAVVHPELTHGYTPLHLVCKTEDSRRVPLPIVESLLACDPQAAAVPDSLNYLPLHHACAMGCSPEVVGVLLEANPSAMEALTHKKDTALSLACSSNNSTETVKLLLASNPKAATQTNDYGFCPLHCVCRAHQPRMESVRALLEACPSSVGLRTNAGETPIDLVGTNTGAFYGVLDLLLSARKTEETTNSEALMAVNRKTEERATAASTKQAMVDPRSARDETPLAGGTPNGTSPQEANETASTTTTNNKTTTNIGSNPSGGNLFRHPDRMDSAVSSDPSDTTDRNRNPRSIRPMALGTNKTMENTPLHEACYQDTPYEQLETIAKANPEHILVRNVVDLTPLQILCKNGRIDERIISTFAQMGGPEIFSAVDSNGNTALHSAMRKDVDVASLRCLIRTSPDALRSRTTYGDFPLHLACLRRCSAEVIQEVAIAASSGDVSLALVPNVAGQTPIGIAMAEFKDHCIDGRNCTISSAYRTDQRRIFQVLCTLAKIVHYGPLRCQQQGMKSLSLLRACMILHRKNVRLDPAFIQQAIHVYPEEVKLPDEVGNYPLHIEAGIPIEKMPLLDGACSGKSHSRMGILRLLLEAYPIACSIRNEDGDFPLCLMIQSGRLWGHTTAVAIRAFPPALHYYKGLDERLAPIIMAKVSKECGADTLFSLLVSRPGLFDAGSDTSAGQQQRITPPFHR